MISKLNGTKMLGDAHGRLSTHMLSLAARTAPDLQKLKASAACASPASRSHILEWKSRVVTLLSSIGGLLLPSG